jgi:hypothetical protein
MKKCTLFSISMLLIACLGFVAADCSKCKKGDPGYPNCGDTVIPPPPPPSPTVERWSCLAAGSNTETHPDEGLSIFPYDYRVLELWNNGTWNLEWPEIEHRGGIYQKYTYVTSHNDTILSLDLYEVFNNGHDTIMWEGYSVLYADRYEANPPFSIPATIVHAIDSLQLNSTVMRLKMNALTIMPAYEFYVKMQ